jgi:hypothetical protein
MTRSIVALLVALFVVPIPAGAERLEPEGCQAFNPGQPTCSYTVTHEGTSPVTGFAGMGDWSAVVKRGKKKIKIAASQEPVIFEFQEGDVVKVVTSSPGSGVIAGHVDGP